MYDAYPDYSKTMSYFLACPKAVLILHNSVFIIHYFSQGIFFSPVIKAIKLIIFVMEAFLKCSLANVLNLDFNLEFNRVL